MSRFSNSTSVSIATLATGKGQLGVLAAQMIAGQSMYLGQTGTGTTAPTEYYRSRSMDSGTFKSQANSNVGSALTQTVEANYDPVRNKIWVQGSTHGLYIGQPMHLLLEYDMATNQWFKMDMGDPGTYRATWGNHSWEHVAVNPNTGDLFKKGYGYQSGYAQDVWKLSYADHTFPPLATGWADASRWTQIASTVCTTDTSALDWVPFINGGLGGLVHSDRGGASKTDSSVSVWNGSVNSGGDYGVLQTVSVVTDNYFYWGCGSGNPNPGLFYRTDAAFTTATRIQTQNIPYNPEIGATAPCTARCHPNGSDFVMFPGLLSGPVARYTASTNQWSTLFTLGAGDSTYFTGAGTWHATASLKDLGVILIISLAGTGDGSPGRMILYKPPA